MLCSLVRSLLVPLLSGTFFLDHADPVGLIPVGEITYIVDEHHVKDAFMGLILVPLVEKAAEHLTGKISSCIHTMKSANNTGV